MALLDFDDEMERAEERRPFANGFEGQSWMSKWCYLCKHSDADDGCVLVDVALVGSTPAAWRSDQEDSLYDRYICMEFVDRKALP